MFTGTFARGVIVLLDQSVQVSNKMTVIVAVKNRGSGFKVKLFLIGGLENGLVFSEPTVTDVSGRSLINFCTTNTRLKKEDCASYLEGNIEYTQ